MTCWKLGSSIQSLLLAISCPEELEELEAWIQQRRENAARAERWTERPHHDGFGRGAVTEE